MKEIKEHLNKMVAGGHTEAKFKHLANAHYFKALLEKRNVPAQIEERLGHATTVDMEPGEVLHKHFHVFGVKSTAHKVLGKFY